MIRAGDKYARNGQADRPRSGPGRTDPPPRRRVFTNRNLRMGSIEAIGFDMDHTLAVYNTDNFNHLSFVMAIEALIRDKGYPEGDPRHRPGNRKRPSADWWWTRSWATC